MAVTEELLADINSEIDAVVDFRSIGMGYDDFCDEYSRLMGQIEVDKPALVGAKMPEALFTKYPAYLYVLTEEHADRQKSEGSGSAASKEFEEELPKSEEYRDTLVLVTEFVLDELKNSAKSIVFEEAQATFNKIMKGSKQIGKFNDIVGLSALLEDHLDIAAEIRVEGTDITKEYLDEARAHAHKLITLKGLSNSTMTDRAKHVDRQNRIFTLCKNAEDKLKHYAKAAFMKNREYYDAHYVNQVFREANRLRQREQEKLESEQTDTPVAE